jgi:hypothetical protein
MAVTGKHTTALDLLTPSTTAAEIVPCAPPPVRELFTRRIEQPPEAVPVDVVRASLQDRINAVHHDLICCSPSRTEQLRARAEMQAHPDYPQYVAARRAAMAAHTPTITATHSG